MGALRIDHSKCFLWVFRCHQRSKTAKNCQNWTKTDPQKCNFLVLFSIKWILQENVICNMTVWGIIFLLSFSFFFFCSLHNNMLWAVHFLFSCLLFCHSICETRSGMPHNKSSYHPFHLSTDRVFGDANGSRESLLLQMYTGEWISLYFPREVHFHLA